MNGQRDEPFHGFNPDVLVERLRQRLAFGRTCVELYDALVDRFETGMDEPAAEVVSPGMLDRFREQQRQHVFLMEQIMDDLGADPRKGTPTNDASVLAVMGLPDVIREPRTSLLQCLEAVQLAEFADNAAWESMQDLCLSMGLGTIIARLSKPLSQGKLRQETLTDCIARLVLQGAKR